MLYVLRMAIAVMDSFMNYTSIITPHSLRCKHTHMYQLEHLIIYFPSLAFGCPEIHPRANQWIEKDGYTIIVSCNGTEDTWTLTCQGSMWVGEIGNCTPSK